MTPARKRRLLKTAHDLVFEAEENLRQAADYLAMNGLYRRAGKVVRLAARVEEHALYVGDDIEFSAHKKRGK